MAGVRPSVSVCIPAYNHAELLGPTIESVLGQSLQDFEIIVADDCSADGTAAVASGFADPRIRVVRNVRTLGAASNWNQVVRMAKGSFIKLLCDDDLLYPNCLARQASVLAEARNQDVELVCCQRDIIDARGTRLFTRSGFRRVTGRLPGNVAVRRIVRSGTNLVGEPTATMFRATALEAVGGFDEELSYMIDLDFWCRLLARGALYVIPEALCTFRVSEEGWSTRIGSFQASQARRFFRDLRIGRTTSVSPLDVLAGCTRATILAVMRQLLYEALRLRWAMKPTQRSPSRPSTIQPKAVKGKRY